MKLGRLYDQQICAQLTLMVKDKTNEIVVTTVESSELSSITCESAGRQKWERNRFIIGTESLERIIFPSKDSLEEAKTSRREFLSVDF
jgi:hypothetical protein